MIVLRSPDRRNILCFLLHIAVQKPRRQSVNCKRSQGRCQENRKYRNGKHRIAARKPHRQRNTANGRLYRGFRRRSFPLSGVFSMLTQTPIIRITRAPAISKTAAAPVFQAAAGFTAAPTSTNSKGSAATQSFAYFAERRAEAAGTFLPKTAA